MTCKDQKNITIRFPRTGLEIRPYTVDLRVDEQKFDYLDAKFSKEVGEYLKQFTEDEGEALRPPQPAEVVMDDEVAHWLFFRPEWVTYGETNCWIELHDPQKHLEFSVVDYNTDGLSAEDMYRRILNEANTSDIIKGIEFEIPEGTTSNIGKENLIEGPMGMPLISSTTETAVDVLAGVRSWTKDYDKEKDYRPSQKITESNYKFDIQNKNALEAIYFLNNELGLQSWLNHEGILKVGLRMVDYNHHVAAPDDRRVWKYSDVELTPPTTPIRMAVVNGGMIDAPNSTKEEKALESSVEFLNPTDSHEQDLIPQGVAQRPDVLDGKIVSIDEPNLARDALEARAYQVLANEMTNNNSGSIEIQPDFSGTTVSDWRNVKVGDFITMVPSEDDDCRDIQKQECLISGVRHKIDGGSWKIKLNIQRWMNPESDTTLRYFSPDSTSYYASNKDNSVGEEIHADA